MEVEIALLEGIWSIISLCCEPQPSDRPRAGDVCDKLRELSIPTVHATTVANLDDHPSLSPLASDPSEGTYGFEDDMPTETSDSAVSTMLERGAYSLLTATPEYQCIFVQQRPSPDDSGRFAFYIIQ